MTACGSDSPVMEQGILLRELNHRIDSGLASAINLVSAAVVRAEGVEAKRALRDVVELLHGHADVQQALATPKGKTLIDAATYLRMTGCAVRRACLDRMNVRLAFATRSLPLGAERCRLLGLIVHELVTSAARNACFDARDAQIKVRLTRTGTLVNCVVADNGSRRGRNAWDRGFRISNELAKDLGGRIERGFGSEFTSVILSFTLTEREQQANWTMAMRQMKPPRLPSAVRIDASAAGATADISNQRSRPVATESNPEPSRKHRGELGPVRQAPDVLGGLLSSCHRTDAL